eukprot:1160429-Pelagomonas_calceolata.AAC.25
MRLLPLSRAIWPPVLARSLFYAEEMTQETLLSNEATAFEPCNMASCACEVPFQAGEIAQENLLFNGASDTGPLLLVQKRLANPVG